MAEAEPNGGGAVEPIGLSDAAEVFVRGFAHVRSMTYPYVASRVDDIWLVRDDPDRIKARGAEAVAICPTPDEVAARMHAVWPPARRWSLCFLDPEDPVRPREGPPAPAAFRAAGYRRRAIEPFFVADPRTAPRRDGPVVRVDTAELAERARLANRGRRQLLPADLDDVEAARTRLYVALDGRDVVGFVSAIEVRDLGSYVANLWVDRGSRRRGLGGALMSAVLADDARLGIPASVLTASHDGSKLYPQLGYRQIATLHMLSPP